MSGRPPQFRINYGHPLAQGLVFAGLGRHVNSTYFHDDSLYHNNGTLTGFSNPPTGITSGWGWNNTLKRPVTIHDGTNDYIQVAAALPASFPVALPYTFSCWVSQVDWVTLETARHHYIDVCDGVNVKISLGWIGGNVTNGPVIVAHDWKNGRYKEFSTTGFAANSLHHVLAVFGSATSLWVDGVAASASYWGMTGNTAGVKIGARGGPGEYIKAGTISDPIIWGGDQGAFVSKLADPAWSIDYGGLILPVWQRVFAAAVAPAAFKAYWVRQRSRIIGGGLGV
jgi:hypothetical protein